MSKPETTGVSFEGRLAVQLGKSDILEVTPKAGGVNLRVSSTGRTIFVPTDNITAVTGALGTAATLVPVLFPEGTQPVQSKTTKRKTSGRRVRRTRAEIDAGVPAGALRGTTPSQETSENVSA